MPPDAGRLVATLLDSVNMAGRLKRLARRSLLVAGTFAFVLGSGLAAAGFFIAGLYVWLDSEMSSAEAAALTGAVLLILCAVVAAALVGLLSRTTRPSPPAASASHDSASSPGDVADIAAREMERSPLGAVFMALAAGVVYGLMDRPRRDA